MAILMEYVPSDEDALPSANPEDATMADENNEKNDGESKSISPPAISKSWAELSAHVPSYSGGKVVLCHGRGTHNLYGYNQQDQTDEDTDNSDSSAPIPFLLAPCGGDLAIIDARRGIKARTIRTGCAAIASSSFTVNAAGDRDDDDDDFDDETMDSDAITAYALAPNDTDLVTATRSNILRHYDLSGTKNNSYQGTNGRGPSKVKKLLGRSGHDLPITHMEFHCSGIFFATGSVDGNVKVWDLRGGYATHSFHAGNSINRGGLRGSVTSLAWCPDIATLWLAIGREDGMIQIHDLRKSKSDDESGDGQDHVVRLGDHVSAVTCMVWVHGMDFFFTAGRDAVLNTWSVEQEEVDGDTKERKKKKKRAGVTDSTKKDSSRTKIVYRRIHTLPIYEQIEGMQLLPPNFYHFHPNVQKRDIVLATAGSKGIVRLWKATPRNDLNKSSTIISGLTCIGEQDTSSVFGEKRGGYMKLLLTSRKQNLNSNDTNGRSYETFDAMDIATEELLAIDAEHNMSFLNLRCVGDEENETEMPPILTLNRTIIGHNDEILDLKILPPSINAETKDGNDPYLTSSKRIAVATNSAQVRLFDLGTYSCNVLDGHTDTVLSLDVSPCGRYLVTCGKDKTTRVWYLGEAAGGRCVAVGAGHTEAIGAVALSKKSGRYDVAGKAVKNGGGAFIVTASRDRTLKRWNLPGSSALNESITSGEKEISLRVFVSARAHEKDINIVSVAPNDSLIGTGSQDKTVKLWNSTDLTLKGTLEGHKRGIWDCQFSSFDRVVATCSGDRTLKLWSLGDFSCIRTFQGHSASTLRTRFLSGGLQLLSSGADGLVKLWTIRTNECEATMDAHTDKVWALDLSPDGKTLVSGGADSKIVVWKDTTKEEEKIKKESEENNILMEQRLANHLRFKEYEQALDIALDMDKPRQALKVLIAIVENDLENGKNGLSTLQSHVKNWPISRISQVLQYCRDWNTRARNCHIAMLTIKAIVRSIPVDELSSAEGIPEILAGITPYAERHFERIDKLHTSTYLIDFTLFSLGNLDSNDNGEYSRWEANNKLVLPPTKIDGRVQVGGAALTGFKEDKESCSDDEVLTLGESSDSSSESDG